MVSLVFNSPSPRTLMGSVARRMNPCARNKSGVTVSPSGNTFSSSRLTTEYDTPNGLWNPRFGMRRCNGICPPSNPRRREYPRRDFCPLFPEPAVFPSFEPMPRPTRTFFLREPLGGRNVDKLTGLRSFFFSSAISLLHHFHEVPHLVNHAACFRRVLALHHLMHSSQAQPANRRAHIIGAADEALDPFHFHRAGALRALLFACHHLFP